MKELVEFIVKRLADHPEQVKAEASEQNSQVQIHLTVAEEDKGKIIGKQGKVIKALRILATALAAKKGKKIMVDVE